MAPAKPEGKFGKLIPLFARVFPVPELPPPWALDMSLSPVAGAGEESGKPKL